MKQRPFPVLAKGVNPGGVGYDLAAGADGKPPTEFRIFAYGVNTSDKGNFVFDEKAARDVMLAFEKKGTALTMDYEHQALNSAINGQPAPNSCKGWTPEVRTNAAGKPELWATNVQWTDRASGMIQAGEYNHFSPAFEADPKSMRIERIINMALTNIPALDNQAPLIAASQGKGPTTMKCKLCQKTLKAPDGDNDGDEVMCTDHAVIPKMSAVFGLKADAGGGDVIAAATEATSFRSTVIELTGAKNPVEALGIVGTLKSQAAEITALKTKIATDEAAGLTKEFDAILDEASKAGKLAPSAEAREKFTKPLLALSGGKVSKEAIEFARNHFGSVEAKIVTSGNDKKPSDASGGAYQLSAVDLDIARHTGVAGVDIIAHKKLEQTGAFKAGMEKPGKFILMPPISVGG